MQLFTVVAENESAQDVVRVMAADHHLQHIYSETKLCGISKAGEKGLDKFFKEHQEGWRITLIVPGRPRLIGYTTGRE